MATLFHAAAINIAYYGRTVRRHIGGWNPAAEIEKTTRDVPGRVAGDFEHTENADKLPSRTWPSDRDKQRFRDRGLRFV